MTALTGQTASDILPDAAISRPPSLASDIPPNKPGHVSVSTDAPYPACSPAPQVVSEATLHPALIFLHRAQARLVLVEAGEMRLDEAIGGLVEAFSEIAPQYGGQVIRTRPTCGPNLCVNPSFCSACRDADRQRARGEQPRTFATHLGRKLTELDKEAHARVQAEAIAARDWRAVAELAWSSPSWSEAAAEYQTNRPSVRRTADLPRDWDRMSLDALYSAVNPRERCSETPQATFDAVVYELRTNGLVALARSNCRRRVSDLSPPQLEQLLAALIRLRPQHSMTITDELILALDGLRE